MIDKTFEPGFAIKLHHKDLTLATSAAESLNVKVPNTLATRDLMTAAIEKGNGGRDHSALYLELKSTDQGS